MSTQSGMHYFLKLNFLWLFLRVITISIVMFYCTVADWKEAAVVIKFLWTTAGPPKVKTHHVHAASF